MKKQAKNEKKKLNKNIKKYIYFAIILLIILSIVFGIYLVIKNKIINSKYGEYEKKMENYYLNTLYSNEKATSTEKVKNNELIKVIIGSLKNTKDINDIYTRQSTTNTLDDWYEYSTRFKINKSVENNNKKATKIDAAILLAEAVSVLLDNDIEQAKLNMSEKKLSKYTADERESIAKAVTLGLIENKTSELSNKKLIKGMLNKMIVSMVEKYATIYYGISINADAKLVTNIEDMPSNYLEYPYIIDTIDKDIYELEYTIQTPSTSQTPKRAYEIMGPLYMQIHELVNNYFNAILNVNYENINVENFYNSIDRYTVYKMKEEDVQDYVSYVQQNKIKLSGKATPLLPIIYNNGEQYIVRTKVEFEIVNSNIKENVLFGDEDNTVQYNENKIVMYVDVPMGMTLNSYSLRIHTSCMAKYLAKDNAQVIVVEK